jgi:voltage-gated potassium channel
MSEYERHAYHYLVAAAIFVLSFGTIFYHFTEKLTWINAYYFSVVTLSTVGYGDIVPHTNAGKIFTTFYIFAGVGIVTAFFSAFVRRQNARLKTRSENRNSNN